VAFFGSGEGGMNIFRRWLRRKEFAPESQEDILPELHARLDALMLRAHAPVADAMQDILARQFASTVDEMDTSLSTIAQGLRVLADQAAHGAAQLDPNALGRILDRMQNIGDATLRQIEGRIGTTLSRTDRSRLQDLRDEMRDWLAARDLEREKAQNAVDELNLRVDTLREKFLGEAQALAKAAELTDHAAGTSAQHAPLTRFRHATPEAGAFSAELRTLLVGTE
jgi:hypothetical protein